MWQALLFVLILFFIPTLFGAIEGDEAAKARLKIWLSVLGVIAALIVMGVLLLFLLAH